MENDALWRLLFDTRPDEVVLDTLLEDAVISPRFSMSPTSSVHAHGVFPHTAHSTHARLSIAATINDDPKASSVLAPIKRKRTRTRTARPKEEIDRLRRSVVDLEKLLALLQQRHGATRLVTLQSVAPVESTTGTNESTALWKAVATRQYKFMRVSQIENDKLRAQIHSHLHLICGLTRLVQRAHSGLPAMGVPVQVVHVDAALFTATRHELIALTAEMYQNVDTAIENGDMSSYSLSSEYGDMTVCCPDRTEVSAGTILGGCRLCRRVPCTASIISDTLWARDPTNTIPKETLQIQHLEQSATRQVMVFTLCIRTATSKMVIFHGVGVAIRVHEASRDVQLMASSMWPSPATETPWHAVGMVLKQWSIVKPVLQDTSDSHDDHTGKRLSEVCHKLEVLKHTRVPAAMTCPEATLVRDFVSATVKFTLDRLQRQLDDMLLGRMGSVCED